VLFNVFQRLEYITDANNDDNNIIIQVQSQVEKLGKASRVWEP